MFFYELNANDTAYLEISINFLRIHFFVILYTVVCNSNCKNLFHFCLQPYLELCISTYRYNYSTTIRVFLKYLCRLKLNFLPLLLQTTVCMLKSVYHYTVMQPFTCLTSPLGLELIKSGLSFAYLDVQCGVFFITQSLKNAY